MIYRNFLSLIFVAFSLAANASLAETKLVARLDGMFKESLNPDVKVSGAVVVGVTALEAGTGEALRKMAIHTFPGVEKICLDVQTSDGVYSAQNEYSVPEVSVPGTVVRIPYDDSQYLKQLGDYKNFTVAVKASIGGCGVAVASNGVLPVHLVSQLQSKKYIFYINSMNSTDVYLKMNGREGVCELIENRQSNFDYICSTPALSDSLLDSSNVSVLIERERYGRELPPVEVVIFKTPRENK